MFNEVFLFPNKIFPISETNILVVFNLLLICKFFVYMSNVGSSCDLNNSCEKGEGEKLSIGFFLAERRYGKWLIIECAPGYVTANRNTSKGNVCSSHVCVRAKVCVESHAVKTFVYEVEFFSIVMYVKYIRAIIRILIAYYIEEVNIIIKPFDIMDYMILNYDQQKFVKNLKIFLKFFINKHRNRDCVINYKSVEDISMLRKLINCNLKTLLEYTSDDDYNICLHLLQVIIISSKIAGRCIRYNYNHRKFHRILQPMIFTETIIAVEDFLEKRGIFFTLNDFKLKTLKNIVKKRTRIIVIDIENNLYTL